MKAIVGKLVIHTYAWSLTVKPTVKNILRKLLSDNCLVQTKKWNFYFVALIGQITEHLLVC